MNKKQILTGCLLVSLAATAIGGTLAYFTDSDADVNVMTTGNLQIVQNETDREGNAYTDGQTLLPAVYFDEEGKTYNPTATWQGPDGGKTGGFTSTDGVSEMELYTDSLNNEIDTDVCARETIDQVKVGEEYYEAWIFTYNEKVEAGKTSKPSLKQVWLDPMADNGWYDMLGEDGAFTIVAFSQATQVAGFETLGAEAALDAAFGDVTAENIAEWVEMTGIKTTGRNNVIGGGIQ